MGQIRLIFKEMLWLGEKKEQQGHIIFIDDTMILSLVLIQSKPKEEGTIPSIYYELSSLHWILDIINLRCNYATINSVHNKLNYLKQWFLLIRKLGPIMQLTK